MSSGNVGAISGMRSTLASPPGAANLSGPSSSAALARAISRNGQSAIGSAYSKLVDNKTPQAFRGRLNAAQFSSIQYNAGQLVEQPITTTFLHVDAYGGAAVNERGGFVFVRPMAANLPEATGGRVRHDFQWGVRPPHGLAVQTPMVNSTLADLQMRRLQVAYGKQSATADEADKIDFDYPRFNPKIIGYPEDLVRVFTPFGFIEQAVALEGTESEMTQQGLDTFASGGLSSSGKNLNIRLAGRQFARKVWHGSLMTGDKLGFALLPTKVSQTTRFVVAHSRRVRILGSDTFLAFDKTTAVTNDRRSPFAFDSNGAYLRAQVTELVKEPGHTGAHTPEGTLASYFRNMQRRKRPSDFSADTSSGTSAFPPASQAIIWQWRPVVFRGKRILSPADSEFPYEYRIDEGAGKKITVKAVARGGALFVPAINKFTNFENIRYDKTTANEVANDFLMQCERPVFEINAIRSTVMYF